MKRDPSKARVPFKNFKINEEVVEPLAVVGWLVPTSLVLLEKELSS